MKARAFALALCAAAAGSAAAQDAAPEDPFADRWIAAPAARLQALDKVTGRVSGIDAPLGAPVRFGTLSLRVLSCFRRPPELPPESAAFMEIGERRRPEDPEQALFRGWMFASSPGLSALEHAVYDVVVLDCPAPPVEEAAGEGAPEGGAPETSGSQADAGAEAGSE